MDNLYSPYGPSGAAGPTDQNSQLAMLLKQLLGNQQGQPGAGGGAPAASQAPTASSNQGPFANSGNLIKGLLQPAPTSILGQVNQGLFGRPSLLPGTTTPSPGGTGLPTSQATYEGNIPTQANPANANGTMGLPPVGTAVGPQIMGGGGQMPAGGPAVPAPQPDPFSMTQNPAGPDAMTQALMAPPANPMSQMPASPDIMSTMLL